MERGGTGYERQKDGAVLGIYITVVEDWICAKYD